MDPRNTAQRDTGPVAWEPPSESETRMAREAIEAHRTGTYERIELEVTPEGCEVTTDTSGRYPVITLECGE